MKFYYWLLMLMIVNFMACQPNKQLSKDKSLKSIYAKSALKNYEKIRKHKIKTYYKYEIQDSAKRLVEVVMYDTLGQVASITRYDKRYELNEEYEEVAEEVVEEAVVEETTEEVTKEFEEIKYDTTVSVYHYENWLLTHITQKSTDEWQNNLTIYFKYDKSGKPIEIKGIQNNEINYIIVFEFIDRKALKYKMKSGNYDEYTQQIEWNEDYQDYGEFDKNGNFIHYVSIQDDVEAHRIDNFYKNNILVASNEYYYEKLTSEITYHHNDKGFTVEERYKNFDYQQPFNDWEKDSFISPRANPDLVIYEYEYYD